jgi:hypothetical protein
MGIFLSGEGGPSRPTVTPDREQKRQDDRPRQSDIGLGNVRHRPYDTTELDKVPRPTDDDPPYRSWWVL